MQIYERVTKSRSHTIPLKSKNHQYILCIDDFLRLSQTFDIYQNLDYITDIKASNSSFGQMAALFKRVL